MRFNASRSTDVNNSHNDNYKNNYYFEPKKMSNKNVYIGNNNLLVIDTLRVDEHSRITLSKRVKKVFPIQPNDVIVVSQDLVNDVLQFDIQRFNEIADTWIIKKRINNLQLRSLDNTKALPQKISKTTIDKGIEGENQKQSTTTVKIMIVDDEPDIIEMLKEVLSTTCNNESNRQFAIDSFASSTDALQKFIESYKNNNDSFYDLIIVDIKMSTINGAQLYQILKIIDPKVNILFVTALDAAEDLPWLFPGIKPNDIIKKPIVIEHFISKVEDVLSS
jgi:CheY-like chemotaxis protein